MTVEAKAKQELMAKLGLYMIVVMAMPTAA